MSNLIIGAIDNLGWDQIKYWCNSIKMTGFTGHKVVVALNVSLETVEKLQVEGFEVACVGTFDEEKKGWAYRPQLTVHVERFFHIWNYLRQQTDINMVVMTDVRDVVFQSNPFHFFNEDDSLICSTECLWYKDEPWGAQNLRDTFGPWLSSLYETKEIYNVGVLGGKFEFMRDLALMIFQMSIGRPIPICDQAVFNFLLWQEPYLSRVARLQMSEGWAIHCGTVVDPAKLGAFLPNLLESVDDIKERPDGTVQYDSLSVPVFLHQWDRVPKFKALVERKYG